MAWEKTLFFLKMRLKIFKKDQEVRMQRLFCYNVLTLSQTYTCLEIDNSVLIKPATKLNAGKLIETQALVVIAKMLKESLPALLVLKL